MADPEKVRGFVLELSELSRKWGLQIGGCGDCGSPWVLELDEAELQPGSGYGFQDPGEDHLTWFKPQDVSWAKVRPIQATSMPVEGPQGERWEPVEP